MKKISLVAFLGNYGREYENTRHNVAWLFEKSLSFSGKLNWQSKFKGQFCKIDRSLLVGENQLKDDLIGESVYFLKPETYMNLSGESIIALMQFFKIKADEVLVVHDELELPCGTVSLKWSGGLGGHNGLRSTKENLGTADFWRLRFGIGRPDHKDIAGYVLSNFTSDEKIILSQIFPQTEKLMNDLFTKNPDNLLNSWKKKNLAPST